MNAAWRGSVWVKRLFKLRKRHGLGPAQAERPRGLAQAAQRAFVRRGHHAEQAGLVRLEQVRHRHVASQRERRIAFLSQCERTKAQFEPPISAAFNLLLGRIDPGRAALCLSRRNSRGKVNHARRQLLIADGFVGQFGAAADDRALDPGHGHAAIRADAHGKHHRRARAIGQKACRAFGQHRRVKPGFAIGQISRHPALPGFAIERIAIRHKPRHVRNRVMQQQVRPGCFDCKGLIQISRAGRIERDKVPVGAISVRGRDALRRLGCGGQHGGRVAGWHAELRADCSQALSEQTVRIAESLHPTRLPSGGSLRKVSGTNCTGYPTNEDPRRCCLCPENPAGDCRA